MDCYDPAVFSVQIPLEISGAYAGMLLLLGLLAFFLYLHSERRTAKRVRELYQSLPGRICVVSRDERILYLSGNEDGKSRPIQKLDQVPGIDYRKVSEAVRRVFLDGRQETLDYESNTAMRSISLGRLPRRLFGEDAVVCLSHDSSNLQKARKAAEDSARKLEQSTRLWKNVIDTLPLHIFAKKPEDGFRYAVCNRSMTAFFGLSEEEIIGSADDDLFSESEVSIIHGLDSEASKNFGSPSEGTVKITGRDGKEHYFRSIRKSFTGIDGTPLLLGAAVDITELAEEQKRARMLNDELQDLLLQHRILLDNMNGYVFVMDIDNDFRYVACNRSCFELWGRFKEESIGKNDMELFGPELGRVLRRENEYAAKHATLTESKIHYRGADGISRIGRFYRKRIDLSGGRRLLFGFGFDITDQEKTKAELQDLLVQHAALLDSIPACVYIKDISNDFRYVSCNEYCAKLIGIPVSGILGKNDRELFSRGEESDAFFEDDSRAAETGTCRNIRFFTGADGVGRLGRFFRKRIELSGGRNWLFCLAEDITDLDEAKRRAEENAEWFRRTLESIGDGVLMTDSKGMVVMLNPVAERMLGWSSSEAVGRPHEEVFRITRGSSSIPASSPLTRAIRSGMPVELANHTDLTSRDGSVYHISDSAAPIFDGRHEILGAILVFRDVTEEYVQRDRLRLAVDQLEAGAELTKSASFIYDPVTGDMSGSKRLPLLWPIRNGKSVSMEEWVLPGDWSKMRESWEQLLSGKIDRMTFDFRALNNGSIHSYRIHSIRTGTDRKNIRFSGMIQDVTEIARSAKKLREQQNLCNLVVNSIPAMIFVKDTRNDFRYTLANRAFSDFIGYRESEIIGKNDGDFLKDKKNLVWLSARDGEVLKTGMPQVFQEEPVDSLGQKHNLHITKLPFRAEDGTPMILGITVDVTDLNRMIRNEQVVNDALREVAVSAGFEESVGRIAKIIQNRMKSDRVMLALYEDGKFRMNREWCAPGIPSIRTCGLDNHYKIWDANLSRVREDQIIRIENLQQFPGMENLRKRADYPIRSVMIAPVFVHKEIYGALFVSFAGTPHVFTDSDEKLMRSMASILALAEIRDRQNREIQCADRQRQMILDNINIPIWLYDGDGAIVRINRSARCMFGISPEDIRGKTCCRLLRCPHASDGACPVRLALDTGTEQRMELVLGGKEYNITVNPIRNDSGAIIGAVMSAFDVTGLNALIMEQNLLNFSLETLLRESSLETSVRHVLKAVCEHFHAERSFVFRFDPENRTFSNFVEYASGGKPAIFSNQGDRPFKAEPNWIDSFRENPDILCEDLLAEPPERFGAFWSGVFRENDFRSFYGIRLMADGAIRGFLWLAFGGRIRRINESERRILGAIAHFIEFMLEREKNQNRLLDALKQTRSADAEKAVLLANEQVINQGLSAVLGTDDPADAATHVLRTICRRLGATRGFIQHFDFKTREIQYFGEYVEDPEAVPLSSAGKPLSVKDSFCFRSPGTDEVFISDATDPAVIDRYGLWADENKKFRIDSICMTSLRVDGTIWGVFGLTYENGKHLFSEDERNFLSAGKHLIELMVQRNLSRTQLLDALRNAEKADKAKSFFIASVSHEIRTPLNAVIGFSELLRNGDIAPELRKEYLDSIVYSGNSLLELVNDVLDLSKLEADQMPIIPVRVDFRRLARDVMKVFEFSASGKKLSLECALEEPMPELMLDKTRIRQILLNLIGNAVKFTEKGSVILRADFRETAPGKGLLRFSVDDTGIGISAEDQTKLMEPFIQLSRMGPSKAGGGGTGLGLAISRRLAVRMGGVLGIQSEPGKGSSFRVELPHTLLAEKDLPQIPKETETPETPVSPGLSILLVDDVHTNLLVMSAMCREAGGKEVVSVDSGEAALEEISRRRFDVVLTDLWMPGLNGMDLVRRIRGNPESAGIPVFAVTADVESGRDPEMKAFNGILQKPVTMKKITETLRHISPKSDDRGEGKNPKPS